MKEVSNKCFLMRLQTSHMTCICLILGYRKLSVCVDLDCVLLELQHSHSTIFNTAVSNMAASEVAKRQQYGFTYHPSASLFATSLRTYLAEHSDTQYSYIAVGALVFDRVESTKSKLLLLQRAANDSMPNRWEIPGGCCEDTDETILHGVARELWEEAGLNATFIGPSVGSPYLFSSGSGNKICKFTFVVETEHAAERRPEVRTDPLEHQRFLWASEDEVRSKRAGSVDLVFTTQRQEDTILAAFAQLARNGDDL
jgi:8-oxo-dGTP pyrophosphatase MutT (NUDIX family)